MKRWLLGAAWALFIITAAVVITLNFRPLYYWDMDRLQIPQTSGYSEEQIVSNYKILIDYQNFWGPDRLEMPDFPMSDTGRIHFEEVKVIFVTIEWMMLISGVLAIGGSLLLRGKDPRCWRCAAILTPLLPAVVGACIAVNWEWAFVTFHHIFFNNDYWLFDAGTDPVITVLPDEFFMHCALMILALILLGGGICLLMYLRGRKNR